MRSIVSSQSTASCDFWLLMWVACDCNLEIWLVEPKTGFHNIRDYIWAHSAGFETANLNLQVVMHQSSHSQPFYRFALLFLPTLSISPSFSRLLTRGVRFTDLEIGLIETNGMYTRFRGVGFAAVNGSRLWGLSVHMQCQSSHFWCCFNSCVFHQIRLYRLNFKRSYLFVCMLSFYINASSAAFFTVKDAAY